ncbi:MAG: glycerophosphodiester phosphodiesterase [candidate division NC10 bacterium]|nr:glycerophosphodiester phosphodiesterase [candidate division NC10 bacterium]
MIRTTSLRLLATAALLALAGTTGHAVADSDAPSNRPIVIGHRGASGYVPEHTLVAYALAVHLGADFIEPDLVSTKDGHLIARHENILNETTNVADHPEFANRKTTKVLDGVTVNDAWWSEDFTLAEIKTLRAKERIPGIRPGNARLDGQLEVPTLQEVIDLAKALEKLTGRKIGIYPETKHPTYFDGLGLSLEEPLVEILHKNGYERKRNRDRVFIQSFEISNLRKLRTMTKIPLVQLFGGNPLSQPFDVFAAGGTLTYGQMATPAGLEEIATYADGVGPAKSYVIPLVLGILDPANATKFVENAHAVGLLVHPYTFRVENTFLPLNLRSSPDPNARGNGEAETRAFLDAGIDGFFTDNSDVGVKARDAFVAAELPLEDDDDD